MLHQILKAVGTSVVSEGTLAVTNTLYDYSTLLSSISYDLTERLLDSTLDDLDTRALVVGVALELLNRRDSADVSGTTTRYGTLFDRCTCSAERILDTILLLLHLDLAASTYVEDGNTARELSKTLLELLTIIVALRILNLMTDLVSAICDSLLVTVAIDDSGLVLDDRDRLSATEHVDRGILQRQTCVLANDSTTRQDSHVT